MSSPSAPMERLAVSDVSLAVAPDLPVDMVAASPDQSAAGNLLFSIVIANFNYGRFVADAIESALNQTWPHVEVIVVDDGSTDGSREIINRYGGRIQAIFQDNSGQRIANNAGFAASRGDVVIFLDADDVLDARFAEKVTSAWRSGVSKVQVQVSRVDAQRRPLGYVIPALASAPSSMDVRDWMLSTGEYPTPPGSGNAYSRPFLGTFFPIGPECDSSTDSTCLALAPLLGDVVTILEPLVEYRMHGSNDSSLGTAPERFGREVARAIKRHANAEQICVRQGVEPPQPGCIRRGRHLLQLRAASRRLAPASHPAAAGSYLGIIADGLRSLRPYGIERLPKRLLVAGWTLATMIAPKPVARWLVARRFARTG